MLKKGAEYFESDTFWWRDMYIILQRCGYMPGSRALSQIDYALRECDPQLTLCFCKYACVASYFVYGIASTLHVV